MSSEFPLTEDENSVFISVNFIPDFFTPDFVFCANAKRLNNIENAQNITGALMLRTVASIKEEK